MKLENVENFIARCKVTGDWQRVALKFAVSEAIATKMKEKGIKRSELARRLGCSRANVTMMLQNGNLTTETLADVARVLGCQVAIKLVEDDERQAGAEVR